MRNLFLLLLLASGCTSLALQSSWMDSPGGIDRESWRSALIALGERDASLAVQNDAHFIRVSFITTDPALQERILHQGIFIWLDPYGGESHRFGIRYPVAWGAMPVSVDGEPHPEGSLPGSFGPGWGKPGDDIEIYTDGYKEYERVGKKDAGGIDAGIAKFSDTLLCQITVPLRGGAESPYAFSASPGDLIGVGIETRANLTSVESIGSILPLQAWRQIRLAAR
ncbi:MAG TPA: hypothetical protein VMF59_08780 [Bacteroidota bacterium]|nr:hypothetical protein [Bacteroidota bacterium]